MPTSPDDHQRHGPLRLLICGSTGERRRALVARLACDAAARVQDVAEGGAPRSFATSRRTFIVAAAPDDEPPTLDTLEAAAAADLAIVLVDARRGFDARARHHALLASVSGVRRIAFAIDGADAADGPSGAYARLESDCRTFACRLPIDEVACIPVLATGGGLPWHAGPSLLQHLESTQVPDVVRSRPFRMRVSAVEAMAAACGGHAGTIASGKVGIGDAVRIVPSGREARVARIATADGDLREAAAGAAVVLALADGVEARPGDVICAAAEPVPCADQFEATLVWLDGQPLLPGRSYALDVGGRTVAATVAPLKHRVDTATLDHLAATKLERDEIGVCQLELDGAVAFEPCATGRELSRFTLCDPLTGGTVGAGVLHFALRRADNVHWQAVDIDRAARAALKGQKPCVLWFTGIPASGKSTIANRVERRLHAMGRHTYLLDGDNIRHGLNKDLGFTEAARVENIRRIAEVAKLMADAGLIVLAAFISPFRAERRMARALLPPGEFVEIFVDTPVAVAEARDPKGLYRKARRGELANFTGIDSPYERPEHAELVIDGAGTSPERAAELVVELLARRGL